MVFAFHREWFSSVSQVGKNFAGEIVWWEKTVWIVLEGKLQILHDLCSSEHVGLNTIVFVQYFHQCLEEEWKTCSE